MKNLLSILFVLALSGCAAAPMINGQVTADDINKAEALCKPHKGLKSVATSFFGTTAFCADREMITL